MKRTAPRVAVAVSGGRDSTALLHSTLRAAAPLGVEVVALHVHHGLVAQADAWLAQVRRQSKRWGAAFVATRLTERPAPGDSVEAWARRQRYKALAQMAHEAACTLVLLAHHRRDQAETFLLQALRGGGPAGLAAMPAAAQRQGIVWARPWLDQPREAIEAYVQRHRLRFVDDASNADPRFARNRLRLQVWPALAGAFADAELSLAAAARQAQEALALAHEAAAQDGPGVQAPGGLLVAAWSALPQARRRNVLRAWLSRVLEAPVPRSLLDRLCVELPGRRAGAWPAPGQELRVYRGLLAPRRVLPADVVADADVPRDGLIGPTTDGPPGSVDLGRAGTCSLPDWQGHFEVTQALSGGVAAALLRQVLPSPRRGGERFHLTPAGSARSLKKQYQAAGVPAWARAGPLLWLPDGRLLFAPGLGIDAALQAAPGQPQLGVRWCAGAPGPRQSEG